MKKILFATTALIATAGVAAADVSFSGYGRFGAMDNGTVSGLYTRIRLQIDMSMEADNGLEFGARLRHQVTTFNGSAGGWGFNGVRMYVKSGGFELGVGNIHGAIEFMPGLYMGTQSASIGLSGLGFSNLVTNTAAKGNWGWDAYSSAGAGASNGVEVKYAMGDFGVHVSYSDAGAVERTAIAVKYSFSDWTVGLAYQDSTVATEEKLVLTVGGNIGPAKVGFQVADNDGEVKMAVNAIFEVGAATKISAFIASEDTAGESYGLGVSHSLGGGASLEAGVVENVAGTTMYDMGVRFNF